MPLLTAQELAEFPEISATEVVPFHVGRYLDMKAMSARHPVQVIGAANGAMIKDRPGFEVDFLQGGQDGEGDAYATDRHEVLMVHRGHWRLQWPGGAVTLAPGDTCAVPPGLERSLKPTMTGETALFRVRNTDDPAGPTASRHWQES